MIDMRRYLAGWRAKGISLLLSLSLALSLVGPLSGLPEKEGYIPICTGGEIIYIPFGATGLDQPAEDVPAPISETCPWFAQLHAVEVAPVVAGHSAVVYRLDRGLPAHTVAAGQQTPKSFQARAPPLRGA